MDFSDKPIYTASIVCDDVIDEAMVQQPDIPSAPLYQKLWYGLGCVEALYQINHITTARALRAAHYDEVIFIPKLKEGFRGLADARIVARDRVVGYLRHMGFETTVNVKLDNGIAPDMRVHVALNNSGNLRRMRVFGPYMMFDKSHMLTQNALSPRVVRTR